MAEWEVIDGIRRGLETPIESEMLRIFDEQLQEIEANLQGFRDSSFTLPPTLLDSIELRQSFLSLDAIFDFARWIGETVARLSNWFRMTVFTGYETGRGQIDVELPDLTSQDPIVRSILDTMNSRSRLITDTTRDMLGDVIERALQEGWSIDKTTNEVQMLFEGMKDHRARLIATTNVTAGFGAGQLEAFRRAGVDKRWLSQRDGRVRPTHTAADGQEKGSADYFEVGRALLMYPGDPETAHFEEVANCFVGDTEVYSPNMIRAFRSVHNGEVVTIETARGHKLSGTPNHPILTPDGFVKLGSLQEGMDVLSSSESDWASLGELDVDNAPSKIEEVFDALDRPWQRSRMAGLSVNFHGDRPDSDVDVVWPNRLLRDSVIPEICHPLYKSVFILADVVTGILKTLRLSYSVLCEPFRRLRSYGFMGRMRKPHAFSAVRLSHSLEHGFAPIAPFDSSLSKPELYNIARYTESLRKGLHARPFIVLSDDGVNIKPVPYSPKVTTGLLQSSVNNLVRSAEIGSDTLDRFPVGVSPDKIVNIKREHNPTRFVYTLETAEGIYLAGGIVSRNCRCAMLPVNRK